MTESDLAVSYELTQAKALYCYNLDARDWGALGDLLTEDSEFELSDDRAPLLTLVGREAIIAMLRESFEGARSVHHAQMPLIDVADDQARVVWTMHYRTEWNDGRTQSAYGQCRERWVHTTEGWKLAEMRLTQLLIDTDPGPESTAGGLVRQAEGHRAGCSSTNGALWAGYGGANRLGATSDTGSSAVRG